MKIHVIEPGTFKLDGGATFGVIPKTLWSKVYPADENNLCTFSLRLILIETDNRKILLDTGIGNKQSEDFYKYYFRKGHHSIEKALLEKGFHADEITDVILTHLHFDHVGGAVKISKSGKLLPTFINATYYVSKDQWEWATHPNVREKASYLNDNIIPLKEHGVIRMIQSEMEFAPGVFLKLFYGHTAGLIVPIINYQNKILVYTNDLVALSPQVPSSWVCGYDTQPLISMKERTAFFNEAAEHNYILVFQHDHFTECCTVKKTEKGVRIHETFNISEVL
jgi:glyoxylase-like metal-dependent hydrolase (beta-lactamase superfamily II)